MPSNLVPKVRCRLIASTDLADIVDLLTVGFPRRSRGYWVTAFGNLTRHMTPEGYPKYGYMLEYGNRAVGAVLLIFASARFDSAMFVRCNVSSWYVEPAFRSYASMLVSQALKHHVTYLNVSPAQNTLPIIEAQGFIPFCEGVYASIPAIDFQAHNTKVTRVSGGPRVDRSIAPEDLELLSAHERFGCISLWCETPERGYPFVFRKRYLRSLRFVPCAQLIYTPTIDDLVLFAGSIGRFLALRGMPFILIPANGPVRQLVGKYFNSRPMYYRGPDRPRIGDLAFTEAALFGF